MGWWWRGGGREREMEEERELEIETGREREKACETWGGQEVGYRSCVCVGGLGIGGWGGAGKTTMQRADVLIGCWYEAFTVVVREFLGSINVRTVM